jgi:shikimate kinase / 3-dehydroquinate synthase
MTAVLSRRHLPAPSLPPGRPRLVVAGFMGTGKTEGGRRAARTLSLPFIDVDAVVERRTGLPVESIFARDREAGFRQAEREAMRDAARLSGAVVAVGGGAVLSRDSFAGLAKDAVVVVLTCDRRTLVLRLRAGAGRPLLHPDPADRIEKLLGEREAVYGAVGDPLDTTALSRDEAGARLAGRYPAPADAWIRVEVGGPLGPYPVVIGAGAIDDAGREVARLLPGAARAAIVSDGSIPEALHHRVARSLREAGLSAGPPILLPSGERAKSVDTAAMLWRRFHEEDLDPSDVVVAVGGGAALDVTGFAAATFARGVALVNVPTTLLAMVDAGLGGKVGIDMEGVKNGVGTFHHPVLVVADPTTLGTLPARMVRAGLAECVKAALLASPLVLDVLDALADSDGMPTHVPWLIEQSVRIKAAYTRDDPRDGALRHSLNLGHTFAHAIESASDLAVPHGEAVAMGLLASARLGASEGVTDPGLADRLERLLAGLGLPTRPPAGLDPGRLLGAMSADKKRRAGRDVFVVPAPGGAELLEGELAAEAVAALVPAGRRTPGG